MKHLLYIVIFLFIPGIVWAEECAPCKKIIVSGNDEYPPLTWRDKNDPDKITGFAIELLEAACKEIDIEVVGKYVGPWARAQAAVKAGEVDMLGGAYLTEERQSYMDYVFPPFVMDPTVIFIKKGDSLLFEKWDDLVGLKGATPIGNSYGQKFDKFEKAKLTIVRVPKLDLAFKMLDAKHVRFIVYGLYPGLANAEVLGHRDTIGYLSNSVITEGLYFTISKKSPCNCREFKDHLAKKVEEFSNRNLPEQLMEKYLKIWQKQNTFPEN